MKLLVGVLKGAKNRKGKWGESSICRRRPGNYLKTSNFRRRVLKIGRSQQGASRKRKRLEKGGLVGTNGHDAFCQVDPGSGSLESYNNSNGIFSVIKGNFDDLNLIFESVAQRH